MSGSKEKTPKAPVLTILLDSTRKEVKLSWTNLNNDEEYYHYRLVRRVNGGEWKPHSIWNEATSIHVLNVYPDKPYLEPWIQGLVDDSGKKVTDKLKVESQPIDAFNENPHKFLKNEDGSWKFDVVYFGTSDCNSHKDLSDEAQKALQEFVDSGRGALFGHDTICPNFNHTNFAKFAPQAGIIAKVDRTVKGSETVIVVKTGTLTKYPFEIKGKLKVPLTHSFGQFAGGKLPATVWIDIEAEHLKDEETGALSNFYLVTYKNVAMIQTGHSNGKATPDEIKINVNTIIHLYQVSTLTNASDASFYDVTAPNRPSALMNQQKDGSYKICAESQDNGTRYEYRVLASPANDASKTISSEPVAMEAKSGLAGFVAYFSDSTAMNPKMVQFDESHTHILNVHPADAAGRAVFSIKRDEKNSGKFIHVFAVDHANNVSEACVIDTAPEDPEKQELKKRLAEKENELARTAAAQKKAEDDRDKAIAAMKKAEEELKKDLQCVKKQLEQSEEECSRKTAAQKKSDEDRDKALAAMNKAEGERDEALKELRQMHEERDNSHCSSCEEESDERSSAETLCPCWYGFVPVSMPVVMQPTQVNYYSGGCHHHNFHVTSQSCPPSDTSKE